jgi:hypothetical protein
MFQAIHIPLELFGAWWRDWANLASEHAVV